MNHIKKNCKAFLSLTKKQEVGAARLIRSMGSMAGAISAVVEMEAKIRGVSKYHAPDRRRLNRKVSIARRVRAWRMARGVSVSCLFPRRLL